MPWCDDCAKFWSPPSLRAGACPTCGAPLGTAIGREDVSARAPWHFKLLVLALILYLVFRAYQGVFWVIHHL